MCATSSSFFYVFFFGGYFRVPLPSEVTPSLLPSPGQVLYFTPQGAKVSYNPATQSYEVAAPDWPSFVNSNEWHLDTSTGAAGRSRILNFVL